MNERVRISIKLYEKYYVSHRRGEAEAKRRQSGGKHYFLPSFANGIKNDKKSFEIHIIVCLLKTE